ncbi:MAG: hypothetical protein V1800_14960 [Candidatus Latescibacterota bacterium]
MGRVLVGGLLALGVWAMVENARKNRQCFVCSEPLVTREKLPETERAVLESLLPVPDSELAHSDLSRIRVCSRCGRVYGEKWFQRHPHRDEDPEDERRVCDCKRTVLCHPSKLRQRGDGEARVWPEKSKESAWREDILGGLLDAGIRSTCLHCGLSLFRTDTLYPAPADCVVCTSEDKLSLCVMCGGVYQWQQIGDSRYLTLRRIHSRKQ